MLQAGDVPPPSMERQFLLVIPDDLWPLFVKACADSFSENPLSIKEDDVARWIQLNIGVELFGKGFGAPEKRRKHTNLLDRIEFYFDDHCAAPDADEVETMIREAKEEP